MRKILSRNQPDRGSDAGELPETFEVRHKAGAMVQESSNGANVFPGKSEMARRMREFDWNRSAVGPVAGWPQSLKTVVSICIGSRYPIVVLWGRADYTMFYNDGYISFLGAAKHPRWLGDSGRAAWSEIWSIIGPMLDGVFATGEATWAEDMLLVLHRNLPREEAFFTFSYSPIQDDDGKVGGIFCACYETTGRVIGDRRLQTLRDLGRKVNQVRSADEACEVATRTLDEIPSDVPFALIYLLEDDANHARLVATTAGLKPGSHSAPRRIALNDSAEPPSWPLGAVSNSGVGEMVPTPETRFGKLPGGPWPESAESALILPIAAPGQTRPTGFLVAGLSPRQIVDADYRSFLELIVTHIGTAVANARAYETERKRVEALAEIDRAKTLFFSNVSHEFRTPLTLMLGPVEELLSRSRTDLSPAARNQLELVNRNGSRLLRLVNTLLDFSRIEAGRVRASYEATDLASFTRELASVFRAATDRAGLELIVDCKQLSGPVFVDRDMWEKIVLNLISNAFKFTFEGQIAVSLRQVGNLAVLRVTDTGVGIPAAEMPRLFERFHRVESTRSRTFEGSGIGLALVQELVKLHGGTVQAESVVDQGSSFIVSIPLGSAHLPAERLGARRSLAGTAVGAAPFVEEALRWLPDEIRPDDLIAEQAARAELVPLDGPVESDHRNGARRPRVIVADDNSDMRQYVARLLSERYDVCAVADGAAALAAARERRPDLILSDVMMPILGGTELLKQIRSDDGLDTVPVILLSARAGEESRVEGLDGGADDYLVKPFSARELLARVESHLKLARVREQAERRVRNILASITEGFQVIDAEWRFAEINDAGRKIYAAQGLNADDFIGRHVFDEAFPEARESELGRALTRSMMERVPTATESFYEPWGCWLYVRHFPLPEGGVATLFQDITERLRTQEALREAVARYQQQVRRFEGIASATPDFVYLFDLQGRVLYANKRLLEVWGMKLPDVIGKTFQQLGYEQWHHDLHMREIAEVIRTKRSIKGEIPFKAPLTGIFGIYEYIFTPVIGPDGHIELVAGTTRDVTDRKRAEEAVHEAQEKLRHYADSLESVVCERTAALRQSNEQLEAFVYSIAHDLRAPLRAMTGYSQLLMMDHAVQLNDGGKHLLNRIQSSSEFMDKLLMDLLAFGRTASAQIELVPVFVQTAWDQAVSLCLGQIEQTAADVQVVGPLPAVRAHELTLAQCLSNLLGNALKFVAPGVRPCVRFSAETRGNSVRLWLADNGMGIPPNHHERIFRVFERLHGGRYPGTGIGLSIVRKGIERMHGKVGLESESGKGSRFWIDLPKG